MYLTTYVSTYMMDFETALATNLIFLQNHFSTYLLVKIFSLAV